MPGFTGITGQEEIMYADNCSFDGTERGGAMTTNGELFIGSTVSPHIKKGILTSPDSSITIGYASPNITLQANPSSIAYYSLTPYIVGSDIHSQYSTIQDAITAAVSDGASSSSPVNIYIKPGIYTEDLVIYDGIYLIGFGSFSGGPLISGSNNSTQVYGNITFDTLNPVTCLFNNLFIYNNGSGSLFTLGSTNDINLYINSCFASASGTGKAIEITNTGTSQVVCGNSVVSGVDGTINYHPTSPSNNFLIELNNSHFPGLITLNDDSTSACFFNASLTEVNNITNTSSSGVILLGCYVTGDSSVSPYLFNIASGQTVTATNCTFQINPSTSFYSSTGTLYTSSCALLDFSSGNKGYTVNHYNQTTGYNGSEVYQTQAVAHTTDATVTTLFSVVVNELESITLSANISAAKSDHTDSCGGNLIVTVRRESGGNVTLVGVVIANVNSTSTATFTADVDTGTQTVRVRVTGIAATTYNWVSNINYQKVLTNA